MSKRTVSDILIGLETKIGVLESSVRNIDNNYKIILNRLAQLTADISGLSAALSVQQAVKSGKPSVSLPPEQVEKPKQEVTSSNVFVAEPVKQEQVNNNELTEEATHKGFRRDSRKPPDFEASRLVGVQQQILFPDGKPISTAQVEIFNKKGELVKQSRTSTSGRWVSSLEPGEYQIHILKRISQDSTKLPVELRFDVEIPDSKESLQLPSPELPEIYAQGE